MRLKGGGRVGQGRGSKHACRPANGVSRRSDVGMLTCLLKGRKLQESLLQQRRVKFTKGGRVQEGAQRLEYLEVQYRPGTEWIKPRTMQAAL